MPHDPDLGSNDEGIDPGDALVTLAVATAGLEPADRARLVAMLTMKR